MIDLDVGGGKEDEAKTGRLDKVFPRNEPGTRTLWRKGTAEKKKPRKRSASKQKHRANEDAGEGCSNSGALPARKQKQKKGKAPGEKKDTINT